MALTKTHIIHMVVETVVISSISVYFMLRLNKSDTRVAQLENHVRTLYQKNNLLEKVLQEKWQVDRRATKRLRPSAGRHGECQFASRSRNQDVGTGKATRSSDTKDEAIYWAHPEGTDVNPRAYLGPSCFPSIAIDSN